MMRVLMPLVAILLTNLVFPPVGSAADTAASVTVGSQIADLSFKDRLFLQRRLSEFEDAKAIVIVASNTTCPIVQKYWPKLTRMHSEYAPQGVQFLSLNVQYSDSIPDICTQAVRFNIPFPVVKDIDGQGVAALGLTRTPEVVVLDGNRQLQYRGRIDDQYRLGASSPKVRKESLKDALTAILGGKTPVPAETPVDGCLITAPPAVEADPSLTWHEHIKPLFLAHCATCHRPGTETPFGLEIYDDVAPQAEMIAEVIEDRRMPPWYGSSSDDQFINHRGLSGQQRQMIRAWIAAGMPRGNSAEPEQASPEPTAEEQGWQLGQPDQIIQTPTEHQLPADGYVDYKYSIFPYVFTEDTWVKSIEIRPDNPRVVHHANLIAFPAAEGPRKAWFITGKVPGAQPMVADDGTAVKIPAGTALALQIHYTTTGQPERCRLEVGLHFAEGRVDKSLRHVLVKNTKFAIPPGDPFYRIVKSETLPHNTTGIGLFTHMHVRGRDMTFIAHYPDGSQEQLLMIPNYSFDWQIGYRWAPGTKKLPQGTRLECVAHFDNSEFNPFNPDPTATVREGQQTYHEMMYGFYFYTVDDESLGLQIDPATGQAMTE